MQRSHRNRTLFRLGFFVLTLATGCAGLIGVPELTFDEKAPQGNPDALANSDGSGNDGGPGSDGSVTDEAGNTCKANLQTDPANCGRCNHGCVGGTCTAGKCDPVELVPSVGGPEQIAVDGTYLYFTSYAENAVRRVKKDKTGPIETLISGAEVDGVIGLALDGTTLYFSGGDKVHRCTVGPALNSCSTTLATIADLYFTRNITYASGRVIAEANGDVWAIPTNDAGRYQIPSGVSGTWSVAATDRWVYVTSFGGLHRGQADGGGGNTVSVGPLNSPIRGAYAFVEGDSVFWSYKEDTASDAGMVYSQKHDNVAERINYTSTGGYPIGVAADAQYVYWADQGTAGAGGTSLGNGVLFACPRGGCGAGPTILATGLKGGGPMAVDEAAVYFVENDGFSGSSGRIRKVAKP